jgi:hypothetical protein
MDEKPAFAEETSLSPDSNSIAKGFAIWISLLVIVGVLLIGINAALPNGPDGTMLIVLLQPGLWQLLFVIPAVVLLRRRRKFESAKGMLICASALFILNAICSGSLFLGSLR